MKAKELLKRIRTHKGDIVANVHSANGVFHVRVFKKDLLHTIALVADGEFKFEVCGQNIGWLSRATG